MAWPSSPSLSATHSANLREFYVLGSGTAGADTGQNRVSGGSNYTPTLYGTAAYGSDALGVYMECGASGDRLDIASTLAFPTDGAYSWAIVFSRRAALSGNYNSLFQSLNNSASVDLEFIRNDAATTSTYRTAGGGTSSPISFDFSSPTVDDEFCLVYCHAQSGSNDAIYITGGGGAIDVGAGRWTSGWTQSLLRIGGQSGANTHYPGRFRAVAVWDRDLRAVAQDIADDPQGELLAAPAPDVPTAGSASSVGSTTATANWSGTVTGETGFIVESAPDPFSSWTPQGTAAADTTSHPMTGLAPGTDHRFRVASTNGTPSAFSTSPTFTTTSGARRALLLGVG
jgi:hypothetical protein